MIPTLVITIIIEGMIVIGYCIWRKKPIEPIIFTSTVANLITQSLLWIALILFFQHYLATLLITEVLIWLIESLLLYSIPANRLRFTDALLLSLAMNLMSLAFGWFLPI
ncbi:MAG TPA: hypothetical protein VMN99_11770 [Anaerolineales bacterium]|nr:hypothetical protein [Anaerolineales bacterium]